MEPTCRIVKVSDTENLVTGPPKSGRTWVMIALANAAVRDGCDVVYETNEISEAALRRRQLDPRVKVVSPEGRLVLGLLTVRHASGKTVTWTETQSRREEKV